ncbi:MAG: excinuclease ABC subunit UvrA [Candidatus Portnoybacteria bacterium]|nr:excinuclease ABC subunit UvrA [Candidatus Portnoybacteria bacterium]
MYDDFIKIRGAKVNNLKNIDIDIPKNKLVVITGLSGSGKSSLAFDTIYAEGKRRYVESLSAYARQFLGVMDKPDVERIDGLSPAIAIDQKSVSRNPRSTVGTITEIYDYLRLLFARIGQPHCPQCGKLISRQSASQIVDQILKLPLNSQILILGPVVRGRKGEHQGILEQVSKTGFVRVRIDGNIHRTDEALALELDKKRKHNIEVVVDRIVLEGGIDNETRVRTADSVETALKLGKGIVVINQKYEGGKKEKDFAFSELFACQDCGIGLSEISPRIFSFNSPFGACPECQGLGAKLEIDPKMIMPNKNLTLAEGAIRPWANASHKVGLLRRSSSEASRQGWYYWKLSELAREINFSMNVPVKDLSQKEIEAILYGRGNFEGVIPNLQRRWKETDSEFTRAEIEKYMLIETCPLCRGKRLKAEALAIKIAGLGIDQISEMSVENAIEFFKKLKLSVSEAKIGQGIIKEIQARLKFLKDVGLEYLTIGRESTTLSGGESQRIRLATQIGSGLSGVVYILDEPSVGLHQRDMERLVKTLKQLRDLGNSVIVVEHDDQTMRAADWIIDVGPGAGERGGQIVFQGKFAQLLKSDTLTGKYLSGKKKIEINKSEIPNPKPKTNSESQNPKKETKEIVIKGAREHNLKNIDVKIPLEKFVCVTGVSGSGKSSLINDILGAALTKEFHGAHGLPGEHDAILGLENLDKAIIVDQSPIGRTPRSNPATYTGAFTIVRDIFAQTQESRLRGYGPGRFSFNIKGGRCEICQGEGYKKIEMYFLPDVYVECEECHGKRYNKEALEIEYKGKNIADILDMSVEQANNFFKNIPAIRQRLETLVQVGLGYMRLGQPATTLSGGEAQRVKLATELARRSTSRTLYILDEPTTGLHFDDINKLLTVLHALVAKKNSVLVIEHNPQVIKTADRIIDLGPEGGERGGQIVAEGNIQDILETKKSYTGKFLK